TPANIALDTPTLLMAEEEEAKNESIKTEMVGSFEESAVDFQQAEEADGIADAAFNFELATPTLLMSEENEAKESMETAIPSMRAGRSILKIPAKKSKTSQRST
ncbi:hypothetical protein PFISCL1PPCAC_18576, partial [Pristionchus fissidentatus]